MNTVLIAEISGYAGAALGAIMFIPQAYQIWKTKNTKSISLATYIITVIASLAWIIYAQLTNAMPVLIVNLVLITLGIYIILMKLKHG